MLLLATPEHTHGF
ncbi:hypothetical protein LINPERPRIM_LOCUS30771 [Linum perenne]